MFHSARLGLLALLRGLRSVWNTLKSFVLCCLRFLTHCLRSLRRIRPSCSGINSKDIPKKRGLGSQARPSFSGASGCEGYSTIHASRDLGQDPNRTNEPHLPLGSGRTEVLPLRRIVEQSQSAPPIPTSVGPSSLDSALRHLDDFTFTHARTTSSHFSGAPRRSRARVISSSSPLSYPFSRSATPESIPTSRGPSRSPNPSPLQSSSSHRLPQSGVLDSSGSNRLLDVVITPPSAGDLTTRS